MGYSMFCFLFFFSCFFFFFAQLKIRSIYCSRILNHFCCCIIDIRFIDDIYNIFLIYLVVIAYLLRRKKNWMSLFIYFYCSEENGLMAFRCSTLNVWKCMKEMKKEKKKEKKWRDRDRIKQWCAQCTHHGLTKYAYKTFIPSFWCERILCSEKSNNFMCVHMCLCVWNFVWIHFAFNL